jgi:hypothetical protein
MMMVMMDGCLQVTQALPHLRPWPPQRAIHDTAVGMENRGWGAQPPRGRLPRGHCLSRNGCPKQTTT